MIITRTPLRLSLLGGGTDYPSWSGAHGGLTVGGAIDKYVHVTVRYLPPYHGYRHRVVYRETEEAASVDDIRHRAVRAALKYMSWVDNQHTCGLEIAHLADLPGGSGTGSSSAFVVGLVNALAALRGEYMAPGELADAAVDIERNWLEETVGCQDQTFAAYGGLNALHFRPGGAVDVCPLALDGAHAAELEGHLLLFFTGLTRTSSAVAATYAPTLGDRPGEQFALLRMAHEGADAVRRRDWRRLGDLVDRSGRVKAGLSPAVCPPAVAALYARARLEGAWGGKLTGAGGGGCLALVAPPDRHPHLVRTLGALGCVPVPFRFTHSGSTVLFSDRTHAELPRPA